MENSQLEYTEMPDSAKKSYAAAHRRKSFPSQHSYDVIEIKRYKLAELAAIYQVNRKTFRGWLNKFKSELGEREGHYYSIAQVKLIFQKLELPSYIKVYAE